MQQYRYDKDEIKNNLDIDAVASLVSHFGGEPEVKGDTLVAKTICHNDFGEGSHKLYYYENTTLFKCYTNCDVFDIFELVIKVKKVQEGVDLELPKAMEYVANFFGIAATEIDNTEQLEDWRILNHYDRIANIDTKTRAVELKTYDKDILKFYPKPHIIPWEKEGITREVMLTREIAYNPMTGGIIIPHFDIQHNLVGIRERTLVKENETRGKYLPSIINGKQYSHPLSFNLYGIDNAQENIKIMKTALVVEAGKSVMLYESFFGLENSIACATCGGSLIAYQVELLRGLGVKEIIIGFDKDFEERNDDNFKRVVKKLKGIHAKYGAYVNISFLFDKENLLGYKDSPLDKGPEVFQELYKNRVCL